MTTFCTGRFLIDLPEGAKIIGSARNTYRFAQIEKPRVMSREQFTKELDDKEAKLKASKHDVDPSQFLKAVRPDDSSRVLAFWETPTAAGLVSVEGYKWMGGTRFLMVSEVDDDKQQLGISRMQERINGFRPRLDTEIPSDPGYCFPGGFIASPEWENEEALTEFSLPGHPDAYVSVWFYPLAASKRDKPLLERMGGVVNSLGNLASSVHVLRKGDRTVAGYTGQEYLFTAPNGGGVPAHNFVWETQGEGTLEEPVVIIQMETGTQDGKGNSQKPSLNNEEALALWDRIVPTFRIRPTNAAQPKKTSDASPAIPTGPLRAAT
ncbi:MAG: T6SS immunity protein Tli4 family protein, partial [Pseudomonadota bacterium]|nr:T6SS immunity protein Tli4 family protein [Pseudomonadota bacterium]